VAGLLSTKPRMSIAPQGHKRHFGEKRKRFHFSFDIITIYHHSINQTMTITMSTITNKRRRTAADTLHISDLPIGFIVGVSTYLSKTSRAILTVALQPQSSSSSTCSHHMHQLTVMSKAIVSSTDWNRYKIDFLDIEKRLIQKLTDNDIGRILTCINARDVLKKLKMTGCIAIPGRGLIQYRDPLYWN